MKKAIKESASTRLSGKTGKSPQIGLKAQKTAFRPMSFRLTNDDVQDLRGITKEINNLSSGKISDTRVLRALIRIGVGTAIEDLFETIQAMV